MKQPRINRRRFFKLSAFGAGSLALPAVGLASIATAPSQAAQAATVEPHKLSIPQPTFNAIASTTAFGPPADISMGWDGTLWAIDASGAPHLYDPTQDAWLPHGDSIDAAANVGTTGYRFKGNQYVTLSAGNVTSAPQALGATWPTLPDSFKLGVNGAANVNGVLILFNGGRYVPADGSSPAAKLTDLTNWPQTSNWIDGVIDAVGSAADGNAGAVVLFRGAEYVTVNLQTKVVTSAPALISSYAPWQGHLPAGWATGGFDAVISYGPNNEQQSINKGTALLLFTSTTPGVATPQYVGSVHQNWPATWHPVLNHAPSGRMGNLWCATKALGIVQHNGETWNVMPGNGVSAAVGQDGTVMVGSSGGLFRWNGTTYDPLGGADLVQVSVGDAGHVWVRNTVGNVFKLNPDGNTYNPNVQLSGVTHLAANSDGTVWHCTSGNPNAFRLISESSNPSAQIQLKGAGIVTSVNKVASTGFGAAHCLVTQSGQAQPQVYRYDSPYVFKTSNSYEVAGSSTSSFAQGLGNLYFVQEVSNPMPNELYVRFVALDQHTGQEVASFTPPGYSSQYTGMVFDPVNELVYVASAPVDGYLDNNTPGTLYALDARTLAVKWTSSAYRGIDATPALSNGLLCFGDRAALLYCIDTKAALAAAAQGKPIPNKWVFVIDTNGPVNRVSTPLFNGDQVIVMTWALEYDPGEGLVLYTTESVDVRNGTGNNFGLGLPVGTIAKNVVNEFLVLQPPLVKPLLFPGYSAPSQAIIVRAVNSLIAWNLESQNFSQLQFNLPGGTIASSLTYDDGTRLGGGLSGPNGTPASPRLWFGDDQGNLWALDQQFKPVDGTPYLVQRNTQVLTAPRLYKDPQGGLTVLYGVYDPNNTLPPSLYGYDPDNGNHASVPTGVTQITTLSPSVTNGVVYAGGWGAGLTQVFGIRVDGLPQVLRDFVIESQLMQDPDQNATSGDPSNNVPPSVARYQTHLSVVDDAKNPQIHEPVKIWCDTPNTTITVDGAKFTVGPDDANFASALTGADGALVITMDATDYFAPTLRAWAGFMDPYERIVINPDAEFHQRVTTAHANASDDDPDKVNLQTATNYSGKSLFTDDEKTGGTPQNVANSIQQVNKGLGLNNANSKSLYRKMMRAMGVKHKNQRVQVTIIEAAPPPDKYMAYADLPGATHFPTNIPSTRLASIVQPVGLSFIRPNADCSKAPVFSPISHADARAAIDALEGVPWQPNDPYSKNPGGCTGAKPTAAAHVGAIGPQRTFNIFQDFWNWLKGLLDKVLQCILSIAEDILAGIQYVVDGVLKVFKAIIKVLEDVFPFLGSFFKMLEKLIDDVVAALSVLFHFGEIMWTHTWLADQFQSRVNDLTDAITGSITQNLNSFFTNAETAVTNAFNALRKDLNGNTQINNLKGAGATPHTMFTVGPRGGTPSSHAVQCSYGNQKFKSGAPSATEGASQVNMLSPSATAADPVSDFFTSFVNRLSNDPKLSAAFNQLKTDGSKLFSPGSAKQFFTTLLTTLLDILETLIIGALAVTNAFVDGLLVVIDDAIKAMMSILTTEIEIPFLTWLYETLFKEKLTFLNLATLVAAIPVTIICRVVEGQYPSKLFPPVSALQGNRVGKAPDIIIRYLGIFNGMLAFGYGTANAIGDAEGDEASPIVSKISLGIGLMMEVFSFPLIANDAGDVSSDDWVAYGFGLAAALLGIGGVSYEGEDGNPTTPIDGVVQSVLTSILNLMLLVTTIVAFVDDGKTDAGTDIGFAAGLVTTLPGLINPVKLAPQPAPLIVGAVDFIAGCIVGALEIAAAVFSTAPAPGVRRLHLPWVAYSPQPVEAHP